MSPMGTLTFVHWVLSPSFVCSAYSSCGHLYGDALVHFPPRLLAVRLTRPLFASLATRLSIGICGIWLESVFVVGRFSWIVPSSVRCTFCVVCKKRGFAAFDPHQDPVGRKKNITFSLVHFPCLPLEECALPRAPRTLYL